LVGRDPTPAASPRVATRGDAFLSEQGDNTNFRYYTDGLSASEAHAGRRRDRMGFPRLSPGSAHPTKIADRVLLFVLRGGYGWSRSTISRAPRS
ncbi:MAG: hypothetical protein AB7H71_17570, partial [Alphaproteobacteria bacterium]